MKPGESTKDREVIVTRRFHAPRDVVFRAFAEPDLIAKWWGPRGFRMTIHEMNFSVGGVWRFIMHGPDGADFPTRIVYSEIEPPRRIAYVESPDGEEPRLEAAVTLDEADGKTTVTFHGVWPTQAARDMPIGKIAWFDGATETLERLARLLEQHTPSGV